MAKGKKTDNETIYKVMLSYITTRNYSETGRQLDMPESTVRKIIDDNREKPEFAKLCEEKRDEFVEKADKIIYKATELLERRLDTALESQDELEDMIQEIWDAGDNEIKGAKKKAMINKLSRLQLNALNEITTALGTMYDKRALAKGEPTSNEVLKINIELSDD
jgi:hypothetical protein